MNIFVSPIFALTFATVFIIVGGYCLKCILFYYENRENIFNSEKELNKDKLLESFFDKSEFLKTKDSQISKVFSNFYHENREKIEGEN